MSKQRPYGTFEEAYMIQMLTRIPEVLDDFIFSLIDLNDLLNKIDPLFSFKYIQLQRRFYDEPLICEYWKGLCRMYGHVSVYDEANYILAENFNLCIEHLVYLINDAFPPGWNVIQDEPILSLYDVEFM